jgi:3-oxoacyl-[acyl-carrier protein] reductase
MSGNTQKIALVTGGAGGIGMAIGARLARDGHAVALVDLDLAAAEAAATVLPGQGHIGVQADVTEEAAAERAFQLVEKRLGTVTTLIAAAGILILKPDGERRLVAETSVEEWRRTQDVNVSGVFYFCRAYAQRAPRVAAAIAPHGRIVTIASVAGQLGGYRSSSSYITSKAAVIGLTKSLAREMAPFGITANTIAPGLIDTAMMRQFVRQGEDAKATANIPLGRLGAPEDVAGAVAYLVSADGAYVTGATLDVNGGYRMQ